MRFLLVATMATLAAMPCAASGMGASADALDARVAEAWVEALGTTLQTERLFPPQAARLNGYLGVALHEAVAPGRAHGASLAGQLNGLATVPQPDPTLEHEWRIVANTAAARLLSRLFGGSPTVVTRIEKLRERLDVECGGAIGPEVLARSRSQGAAVGDAIFEWAQVDGLTQHRDCPWKPPAGPGKWVPTPLDMRRALEPCWGELRPMALKSGADCEPPPPTKYSEDPGSRFFAEAKEVRDAVDHLSPEQRAIAVFWSDDRSVTSTPSGHWMAIVAQIARERAMPLGLTCEALARVGIAVNDAFISCWHAKYVFSSIRPVTYIRRRMDANWLPWLPTPPFPEHPSGHSVQSAAAARVLTDLLGTVAFTDRVHDDRALPPRSFPSFQAAAEEAGISRLYGGIHFRPSIENGLKQGTCVGDAILSRVAFERCAPEDHIARHD